MDFGLSFVAEISQLPEFGLGLFNVVAHSFLIYFSFNLKFEVGD